MEKTLYHFIIGTGYTPPQGLKIFFFRSEQCSRAHELFASTPPPPNQNRRSKLLRGGGVIENSKKR